MKTFSGLEAPLAPGIGQVSLLDVVVQLGRERRFNNAGSLEWTVLHHSMLVALLWVRAGYPLEEVAFALLHDAHEAYTGDIPGPVKAAIRRYEGGPQPLPAYIDPIKKMEREIDGRIREELALLVFDTNDRHQRRLKICDFAALVIEGVLFGAPGCDCSVDVPPEMQHDVYELIQIVMPEPMTTAARFGRDGMPMVRPTVDRALAQKKAVDG